MSLDIGQLIGWAITLLGIFTTLVFGLFKLLLRYPLLQVFSFCLPFFPYPADLFGRDFLYLYDFAFFKFNYSPVNLQFYCALIFAFY